MFKINTNSPLPSAKQIAELLSTILLNNMIIRDHVRQQALVREIPIPVFMHSFRKPIKIAGIMRARHGFRGIEFVARYALDERTYFEVPFGYDGQDLFALTIAPKRDRVTEKVVGPYGSSNKIQRHKVQH